MNNKWFVFFVFLIGTAALTLVDFDKVLINGNTEKNYNLYYEAFNNGNILEIATTKINQAIETLSSITNIFDKVWEFLQKLLDFDFENNEASKSALILLHSLK